MPIYYALVAKRSNIVLAEYTEYSGNFQQYTMQLMQRIEADTKKTFELEEFLFHYINEDGLTIMCMTDKAIQKKIAFAFMQDCRKNLLQTYSLREIENAKAYGLQTFTDTLKDKIVSILAIHLPYEFYCQSNSSYNESYSSTITTTLWL